MTLNLQPPSQELLHRCFELSKMSRKPLPAEQARAQVQKHLKESREEMMRDERVKSAH